MLVDFSRNLYTVAGEIVQEVSGTNEDKTPRKVPMTLRLVVSAALQAPMQGDEKLASKQREELFDLLMKIHGDPVIELESEEITKLKDRVCKVGFNTLITGQVLKILEGKVNPFEPKEDKEPVNAEEESDTTASTEEIANTKVEIEDASK